LNLILIWIWRFSYSAVIQYYEVEADNEYVIRGNAAIMKCKIPSYISDFVTVDMWKDTENNTYYSNTTEGSNPMGIFPNFP
jgi:hypothetical protein